MIATGISAAAHAVVLLTAAFVLIGTMPQAERPAPAQEAFHVKIASDKPIKKFLVSRAGSEGPVKGVPGYGGPQADALSTGIDDKQGKGLQRKEEFSELLVREKIESKRELPDRRAADRAPEAPASRLVRDDIVSEDKDALEIVTQTELAVPPDEFLPKEFTKEMPGFTPVTAGSAASAVSYKPLRGAGGEGAFGGGGGGGGTGDGEYLIADLIVYKDPSDGKNYFKITVMGGKEAAGFKVFPKDVTFLIDTSLSIQPEIVGFKKGLYYCLDHLNADDTFNLVKFEAKVKPLSPSPLANDASSLAPAKAFIDRLLPSNITDIYGAIDGVLKNPPTRRPSYIVLLSDGRPTAGIKDSREIIRRVTAANKGVRPLFTFCGAGGRVNRYLVDFLSFCNRGWAEYAQEPQQMTGELSSFYSKIKDPVLLDTHYRFSGVDADDVYPKNLSDFFRGVSFVLYGRFTNEDEFSMQLVGEGVDGPLAFIFADSFKRARDGTRDIARQWAYNRIYHLIDVLARKGADPAVTAEIRELYRKYDIQTPYEEGLK